MKLLKTIKRIIKEAEEQYQNADASSLSIEELDRLEKHYKDSLSLLKIFEEKTKKEKEN